MSINDKYLQTDMKTAKKINNIPDFDSRLELATKYIKDCKIDNKVSFYLYLQTKSFGKVFEEITYDDIQAFIRFQEDGEYYNKVQEQIKEKEPRGKIIQLSRCMKKDKE